MFSCGWTIVLIFTISIVMIARYPYKAHAQFFLLSAGGASKSNLTDTGLEFLIARLTARKHIKIISACHYQTALWENESCHVASNEMPGLKGKSRPCH
jgi:hypothetical protein